MPRPIWTGAISFGLVTIPISVMAATDDFSVKFHQYHLADQGRIRTKKTCELDGQEVSQAEIGKAYEVARDSLVAVTDEDLASLPLPTAKAIEIVSFVPADSIDPLRMSTGYYLAASGPVAAKPYTLLRMALERSAKVAVAKFAWHGRERLGLLRVKGDAIVLMALKWEDEIRSPAELAPPVIDLDAEEIDAAVALLEAMSEDDLSGYTDHYREALQEIIAAKASGQRPQAAPEEQPAGRVVDLMAALNASVQAAREHRGDAPPASVTDIAEPKRGRKKTAAKKTTPKKKPARSA